MVKNGMKARLAAGEAALVVTTQLARDGDVARILAVAGYDVLVIDREHNQIPEDAVNALVMAALESGITPLIRLPDAAHGPIGQALSAGALGVVIPRVESAEIAQAIVRAATFPPQGRRPVPPVFPHFRRRPVTQGEATATLAAETTVVGIIETVKSIEAIEQIAAVPGLDVLFLGASDLIADMGRPGAKDDPALWEAAERVVAACRRHGKTPGMGGLPEDKQLQRAIGMGMRYISAGHDAALLQSAATARVGAMRGIG
jgi:4-hydroxy-2-oxoheptanedioate aldolase